MKMNLIHYGLQRSGTNFLEYLLAKKFDVRFLNSNIDGILPDRSSLLHKHFRLYDQKDIVPTSRFRNDIQIPDFGAFEKLLGVNPAYYLIVSKDPYSWFLSYKKWARKCEWPEVPYHYIQEYNLFYGKWLEFSAQTTKIIFVRYIDLLRDPDIELKHLESIMHPPKKFLSSLRSNVVPKVPQSDAFSAANRGYYLTERYMQDLPQKEIQEINGLLDRKVVAELGYQIKEKEDQ
jgi:hypothetical protein